MDRSFLYDFHALPEGYVVFYLSRLRFGIRVVPGGLFIDLIPNHDIVIARRSFPAAEGVRVTVTQMFTVYRIRWKIVIALDELRFITFGQDDVFPGSFGHGF